MEENSNYIEPCVGKGDLVLHLKKFGHHCYFNSDIDDGVDAISINYLNYVGKVQDVDYFITNPPWDRKILHPIINNLRQQKPTWLLFDADWMHTKQSKEYIKYCEKIVSVGRIKWIPDSKMTGKDNCAWYKFVDHVTETKFIGR